MTRLQGKPVPGHINNSLQRLEGKITGSPSPQVKRLHSVWFPKARQFSFQRVEEGRYKLTSTGNHRIVTVATMMAAEGQVQVGGVGRNNH